MYELIPSDTSHPESATGKWYHSTASTIYTQYIFCKIWYRMQYIATGKWYHSTASTHNILFCFIWDKGCDMLGAIYCHQNYSYKFNVCMCVIRIMHVRLLLLFSDVLTRLLLLRKKRQEAAVLQNLTHIGCDISPPVQYTNWDLLIYCHK